MSSGVREPRVPAPGATSPEAFADSTLQYHVSASAKIEHVAAPIDAQTAAEALKHGPRGALVLASIAVGLLFVGWLLFYFVLFIPRGPVG
jgi:hypothetical protein